MAQTLETLILINAEMGSGITELGNTLQQMSGYLDGITEKLTGYGKKSMETYGTYEWNLEQMRIALATKAGVETKELRDQFNLLDEQAREWVADQRFGGEDITNAMREAANAGWDWVQISEGMPSIMNLAELGAIDLSEALSYVTAAMAAGNIDMQDLARFTDEWGFAAKSCRGDVATFGEAIEAMGSTINFADSREELLSLLTVLHDNGTEGAAAGTLLRNAMLRLIAPTDKAKGMLSELGATDEELETLGAEMDGLSESYSALAEHGFSAYDEQGRLRPVLDIYSDMREALAGIAGGYDEIATNEETAGILRNVFGMRSITGAMNIMNGLEQALYMRDLLAGGGAEGYGDYGASVMANTWEGQISKLQGKLERLEIATGERLTSQLEPFVEQIGKLVDTVAGLDDTQFGAIFGALEGIAGVGIGLGLAGTALKGIGSALAVFATNPIGAATLTLTALAAAIGALNQVAEEDYKGRFGSMELDANTIGAFIKRTGEDFDAAYAQIQAYADALAQAQTNYEQFSSQFSSGLISALITDSEITEGSDQYNKLFNLGETMFDTVKAGLDSAYNLAEDSLLHSFAALDENDPANEGAKSILMTMMSTIESAYQADIARAKQLSEAFREALTSAFSDGKLNREELTGLQGMLDEISDIMARQSYAEDYATRQRALRRARSLGIAGIEEGLGLIGGARDERLETLAYSHDVAMGQLEYAYGGEIPEEELALLRRAQQTETAQQTAQDVQGMMRLIDAGLQGSELAGAFDAVSEFAAAFRAAGGIATQADVNALNAQVSARDAGQLYRFVDMAMGYLGSYEELSDVADALEQSGLAEDAASLRSFLDIADALGILTGGTPMPVAGQRGAGDYSEVTGTYGQIQALLNGAFGQGVYTPESLGQWMSEQRALGLEPDWMQFFGGSQELFNQFNSVAQEMGTSITGMIESVLPAEALQTGAEEPAVGEIAAETITVKAGSVSLGDSAPELIARMRAGEGASDLEVLEQLLSERRASYDHAYHSGDQSFRDESLPIAAAHYAQTGADYMSAATGQDITVSYTADTQELQATIDGADGQELMAYVNGDATDLEMSITDQDGRTLTENVTGNASSLASIISSYDGKTITVNIRGRQLFAEGGRATTASIFAEDGPEWAIPEEHSARTAALLRQAAAASGFTWGELIAANGGMNAGQGGGGTLVYSPTIYANDAAGVDRTLLEDKERLERWYEEREALRKLEVYA